MHLAIWFTTLRNSEHMHSTKENWTDAVQLVTQKQLAEDYKDMWYSKKKIGKL
jgi:hypothetical protein